MRTKWNLRNVWRGPLAAVIVSASLFCLCEATETGRPSRGSSGRDEALQRSLPDIIRSGKRRRLEQKGPLYFLHEAWHDVANEKASGVTTECIKKPKGTKGSSSTASPSGKGGIGSKSRKGKGATPKTAYCEEKPSSPSKASKPSSPSNQATSPSKPSKPTSPTKPSEKPQDDDNGDGGNTDDSNNNSGNNNDDDKNDDKNENDDAIGGTGNQESINDRCDAVAKETLETNSTYYTTFQIDLGLRLDSTTSDVETVLEDLRKSLQTEVAPQITNCQTYSTTTNGNGGRQRKLRFLQKAQSSSSQSDVENVVFGPITVQSFVDCVDQSASDSQCLNSAGLVTAYYSGNDEVDIGQLLVSTIQSTELSVVGLQEMTNVSAVTAPTNTPPVSEGLGNSNNGQTDDESGGSGPPAAAIEEPKGNVSPGDGQITAGAAIGVALAALLLLVVVILAVQRRQKQRSYDRRDALKELALYATEDEEDDKRNLAETDDVASLPPSYKVHILNEEDSLMSGMLSREPNIEVRPYDESMLQRSSRQGVVFVPTGIPTAIPEKLPNDAKRSYAHDDTVSL